jgi:hypothetical protein
MTGGQERMQACVAAVSAAGEAKWPAQQVKLHPHTCITGGSIAPCGSVCRHARCDTIRCVVRVVDHHTALAALQALLPGSMGLFVMQMGNAAAPCVG